MEVLAGVVGIVTIVMFGVTMGFATAAIGTVDNWENIQSSLYSYGVGGAIGSLLLMATAGIVASIVGEGPAWILSLLLSVFAFGTAFGAVAMAAIARGQSTSS
jgi:hypothetical protein